jgi:hypothetical protein
LLHSLAGNKISDIAVFSKALTTNAYLKELELEPGFFCLFPLLKLIFFWQSKQKQDNEFDRALQESGLEWVFDDSGV